MNPTIIHYPSARWTRRSVALIGLFSLAASLRAQTDNFDSGTDAGWSKITSAGFPATYSFPPDDFGGHAYRLQGDLATGGGDTARAVAYRADRVYTNFFVAADIAGGDSSLTN